jgi:mitosis inhibitor protein kinase SWE1
MMPPDASRLSISNHDEPSRRLTVNPPATPTTSAGRGSVFDLGSRRAITPVNGHGGGEVDLVLAQRFTKIESIGKGEFSQVFRASSVPSPRIFTGVTGTPPTPAAERVYAVKKLRHAFMGNRDRESKMREVEALKALKGSDNILQYEDSWEHRGHLYIQTEFCEEGSLEKFLCDLGHLGRMDDFRIWKILLEISQVSESQEVDPNERIT